MSGALGVCLAYLNSRFTCRNKLSEGGHSVY